MVVLHCSHVCGYGGGCSFTGQVFHQGYEGVLGGCKWVDVGGNTEVKVLLEDYLVEAGNEPCLLSQQT